MTGNSAVSYFIIQKHVFLANNLISKNDFFDSFDICMKFHHAILVHMEYYDKLPFFLYVSKIFIEKCSN